MNLNPILISKLHEATNLPVTQDSYDGKEDKFIIFTYIDERPEAFADNRPIADTAYMQIQLITPKKFNYLTLKETIRNTLENNEFVVTSMHSFLGDSYQGTENIRQTVFEAKYALSR